MKFAFPLGMKDEFSKQTVSSPGRQIHQTGLWLGLALLVTGLLSPVSAAQKTVAAEVVSRFNERVRQYVQMREKLEGKLPKLRDESKPEEIEAHFVKLQTSLIAARAGTKPGEIFTPDIAAHIRRLIRQEFTGQRLQILREKISEAENKGVPLRVNVPYPETKEMLEMPPTLLLQLPALPKQLRYRFVGRALLLVDREAHLILDYLPEALPAAR